MKHFETDTIFLTLNIVSYLFMTKSIKKFSCFKKKGFEQI